MKTHHIHWQLSPNPDEATMSYLWPLQAQLVDDAYVQGAQQSGHKRLNAEIKLYNGNVKSMITGNSMICRKEKKR